MPRITRASSSSSGTVVTTQQSKLWMPTGALGETFTRSAGGVGVSGSITSGTLRLGGLGVLKAGEAVNSITVVTGTQLAVAPTAQWFCFVRVSDLAVLMKTTDGTNGAWAASTAKTLALSSAYTPSADEAVYVGVLVAAGTPPSLTWWTSTNSLNTLAPAMGGQSTTGLTTPASLGATAVAPTGAAQNATFYAYWS